MRQITDRKRVEYKQKLNYKYFMANEFLQCVRDYIHDDNQALELLLKLEQYLDKKMLYDTKCKINCITNTEVYLVGYNE